MEFYFICSKLVWEENTDLFQESHYLELPTPGIVLVCATFGAKVNEGQWRNTLGVEALPHPLRPQVISLRHASLLERLGVHVSHTTVDVAEQAAKLHDAMRFTGI
jgi:hypothetical protein